MIIRLLLAIATICSMFANAGRVGDRWYYYLIILD